MAAQAALTEATPATGLSPAVIALPNGFQIESQDHRLKHGTPLTQDPTTPPPPLGVLANFTGVFAGTGFNLIFRPNNGVKGTTFPNPVSPAPPTPPSENTLELNLTKETITFATPVGSIPNRGLNGQEDIFLNGVPYLQAIDDDTNTETGKAGRTDKLPKGIHIEPGLWMHVPATTNDPVLGESLTRMASIPHGTTINAQCLQPTTSFPGPPKFPPVDITPFIIGNPNNKITFISQTASRTDTPRLPQDLSKFIATGTITQAILTDPNTVLLNANVGKTITNTTVFTVSTVPTSPEVGGGTANIAFLQGDAQGSNANANAVQMSATFWINKVQHKIVVPIHKAGGPPLRITAPAPHPGAQVPTFAVTPPHDITTPKTITVTSTEIQYSQTVFLNFSGLTWPHVSVATLIQHGDQPVPASSPVWN